MPRYSSIRRAALSLVVALAALGALGAPAASADSIVFLREGNIWRAATDGSNQVQLTTDGGYKALSAAKGSGSPLIAFRQGNGFGLVSADGSGKHAIPNAGTTALESDATIDPSGNRIGYVNRYYDGFNYTYWQPYAVYSVDGNAVASYGFFANSGTFTDPNGASAVVSHLHYYGAGDPNCKDAQGTEYFQLTPLTFGSTTGEPSICKASLDLDLMTVRSSPNFQQLAVTVGHHPGSVSTTQIRVFPRDGSGSGTPVTGEVGASWPDWSPDGSRIVYQQNSSTRSVYVVPAAGGTPVKILDNATRPVWTPYGTSSGQLSGTTPGTTTPTNGSTGSAIGPNPRVITATATSTALTVKGKCVAPCRITTRGSSVSVPGAARVYSLKTATKILPAGGTTTLTVKLSARLRRLVRRALRRHKRVSAQLVLTSYYQYNKVGGPIIRRIRIRR